MHLINYSTFILKAGFAVIYSQIFLHYKRNLHMYQQNKGRAYQQEHRTKFRPFKLYNCRYK